MASVLPMLQFDAADYRPQRLAKQQNLAEV
jgi:hypothetical protein